jgi:small-conductance mechanosensitive channel
VPVGVPYGTDPERVLAVLLAAARGDARLLAEPPPEAVFKGFGASSLDFVVRGWTDQGVEVRASMTSDLGVALHHALATAGIGRTP